MILFYIIGYAWKRTLPQRASEIDLDTGRKSWLTVEEMRAVSLFPIIYIRRSILIMFPILSSGARAARKPPFIFAYTAYYSRISPPYLFAIAQFCNSVPSTHYLSSLYHRRPLPHVRYTHSVTVVPGN